MLKSLIDSIGDLIFYKNLDGEYIGCNRAFELAIGKKEIEITGKKDFDLFEPDLAKKYREQDVEAINGIGIKKYSEFVSYPNGIEAYVETHKTKYYDSLNNKIGIIGVGRDITEEKKKIDEITYLNYHDVLTGLNNRTFFEIEKEKLDTEENLPISVIVGDLNGLKLINDTFGHSMGDKVLKNIAQILKNVKRENDLLARTGGDEFRFILPKTSRADASILMNKIKDQCSRLTEGLSQEIYNASISLGSETKEDMQASMNSIIKLAEEAMYRVKLLEGKSLHSSIINSIKTTLLEKNQDTHNHGDRLVNLSKSMSEVLNITEEEKIALELVSTLHDIGKIGIDKSIIEKPGKLTEEEWREMKRHPEIGYRIAHTIPELRKIAEYILSHHERWDGKGYPQGLKGEEIPYMARIISIIDAYDAMTQDRPYRKAISKNEAIKELYKNSGTQFDPNLVKVFVEKVIGE